MMHPAFRKLSDSSKSFLEFFKGNHQLSITATSINSEFIEKCIFRRVVNTSDIGKVAYFNQNISDLDGGSVLQSIISLLSGEHLFCLASGDPSFELLAGVVIGKAELGRLSYKVLEADLSAKVLEISATGSIFSYYNYDTGFVTGHSFSIFVEHRSRCAIEDILLSGPDGESWFWRDERFPMSEAVPLIRRG
jgi:hypothetical protein